MCEAIGDHGLRCSAHFAAARPSGAAITTAQRSHPLATPVGLRHVDWGTALVPIYKAPTALACPPCLGGWKPGPANQGASLTAFELARGIRSPHPDVRQTPVATLMQHGLVDAVIVGTRLRTTRTADVCKPRSVPISKALAAFDTASPSTWPSGFHDRLDPCGCCGGNSVI